MIFAVIRILAFSVYILGLVVTPLFRIFSKGKKQALAKIKNSLLNFSATELAEKIRNQEITSEEVVRAYIKRIQEVNPFINAVIEDRFTEAIKDARKADSICSKESSKEELKEKFPLLGVPFTVKEACGLKGMSHVVGNQYREGMVSKEDGEVVKRTRNKGGIPLLVSANPEFCVSWETVTVQHGNCNNPYDTRRTSGGSSGGEGVLNASGASVFGVGSDLGGSNRFPALFNGVYGHKPTGTLVSTKGHFPNVKDRRFDEMLVVGPLTRFPEDLSLLMDVFAGENAFQMEIPQVSHLKDLKVFHFDHSFSIYHLPVQKDIRGKMSDALNFFESKGSSLELLEFEEMNDMLGVFYSTLMTHERPPNVLMDPKNPNKYIFPALELIKFYLGYSKHSLPAIYFRMMFELTTNFPNSWLKSSIKRKADLEKKLLEKLGKNGVLIFPTFHMTAFLHNTSSFHALGALYSGVFNMFGFPALHVPMGLNKNGLPVGFQVIAGPYQDKLCFYVAKELEKEFGGWVPPS
ncbi:hypothetical protein ACFFRR_007246 [Megaselia abdita]